MQTLSELLQASVRHFPEKVFIDDGQRQITYREFDEHVSRLANVLQRRGIEKGTAVGLYLPSCPELAIAYHACQKMGAIAVPMSSMFQRPEVESIATRSDMPVLVTDEAGQAIACESMEKLGTLGEVLVYGAAEGRAIALEPLLREAKPHFDMVECAPDDVAVLFFTSGTTGVPKGAMQTHRAAYSTIRDMDVYNRFRWGREVLLSVLPIFSNFGATCLMMAAVYNGAKLVMHQRWDTNRVLAEIEDKGITFMAGTPTMFIYMWKAFEQNKHDLSTLKLAVTGGAPVPPEVLEGCSREIGLDVVQIYGATETSGYVTGEPVIGIRKRGSAGPAFGSAAISILDDEDSLLGPGEVGEVVISGDTIAAGYWRDDETTRASFTDEGWRSGDLGYLDEDGYLFIVDRKKDLIISGGYNIYPIEVEDILYRHPKVNMCAVVGVPDDVKGELPVAFVVADGMGSAELADELRLFCREHLAAYKAPREVKFIQEMPLGPGGKILKRELRHYSEPGSGEEGPQGPDRAAAYAVGESAPGDVQ